MEMSTFFSFLIRLLNLKIFLSSVLTFLDWTAGRSWELILNSISDFGPEGPKIVMGESLDSPETRNVDKMSERCRNNVRKFSKNCPEGHRAHTKGVMQPHAS